MNFITPGHDDLELSTQILINEAMNRNIKVEVLDRKENFIRLIKDDKVEYVKQATKTSADTYISPLIMENKQLTKTILAEHGIRVPRGSLYCDIEQAFSAYHIFAGMDIVIKPNNTNYGVGITILERNSSAANFRQALNDAFSLDASVIIEEFISGKEYRFLIINNKVIAVLHREAANVTGDGIHTIRELIDEKNKHPFRGTGYKKPLEKIKAGSIEALFLESHGKDFSSVPQNGEKVFLRKNSNISTGGDSIDYTDSVSAAYKEIAIKSAATVGAKICGADIIIRDLQAEPDMNNYGVIELNFNPAIHIHSYPYKGKNRHAEKKILDLLGFTEGVQC